MRHRSGYGWLELAIGILFIVLGIWVFADPRGVLTGLAFACGVAAVVTGIGDIMLYVHMEQYIGFGPIVSLVFGIFSVMTGILLLLYPQAGAMTLTLLFPVWFIAHCISRLAHLSSIGFVAGKGTYTFTLIVNIIGLILGFLMLLSPVFIP